MNLRVVIVAVIIALASAVPALAQNNITLTSAWGITATATANAPLTIAFDGGAAIPATGTTWSGTTATVPVMALMPAASKTLGGHTFVLTDPGGPVTLADGSVVTVGGGPLTVGYTVIDLSPNPPKNPKWIKIAGGLAAIILTGVIALGWGW